MVIFDNLVDQLIEAEGRINSREMKNVLKQGDENKILTAVKEGRTIRKDYAGFLNTERNMKKPYKPVGETVNRMRKYINTHSRHMNKIFPRMGLSQV